MPHVIDAARRRGKTASASKTRSEGARRRRRVIAAVAVLLAAVLAAAGVASASGETVDVTVNGSIYYSGYSTGKMYAGDEIAYCAEPSKATPASGTYSKSGLYTIGDGDDRTRELRADLWFGYGGPGFDASMWPSTYYNGTPMDAEAYQACTHILISDTFATSSEAAMKGCSEEFKEWARWYIIGVAADYSVNYDAPGRKIYALSLGDAVPSGFDAFCIETGSATQTLVSFSYTPEGALELRKGSAEPSSTDGNDEYGLGGAVYVVYGDENCTEELTRMTTDSDGYAKVEKLRAGDVWVKELTASKGYDIHDAAERVEIRGGETATLEGAAAAEPPQKGWIEIWKKSSIESATKDNDCYTLEGAEFTIRNVSGAVVDTVTTNADGWARSKDLPLGDYTVTETKSSRGFALEGADEHGGVHVSGHVATHVEHVEQAKKDPVVIVLEKLDAENEKEVPQGDGSLANAQFTIRYYKGEYTEDNLPAKAERTWVVKTDENGQFNLRNDYVKLKVSGDDWYFDDKNIPYFPLGTVVVQEIEAPAGYIVNPAMWVQTLTDENVGTGSKVQKIFNMKTVPENATRAGLQVVKLDSQTGQPAAEGGATLEGAEFTIRNVSEKEVYAHLDDKEDGEATKVAVGADVTTVTTNADGVATTDLDGDGKSYMLPYGTYEVRETKAPTGYELTDEVKTVTVHPSEDENGKIYGSQVSWTAAAGWDTSKAKWDDGLSFEDRVKRGDLSFSKKSTYGPKLSYVPFLVVSRSTGEAHIAVTDENGSFSTAASWNAHTAGTNANDAVVSGLAAGQTLTDYYKANSDPGLWTVDMSKMDLEASVWFGMNGFGKVAAADDAYGALPYDTERFEDGGYDLIELHCDANDGYSMVSTRVSISRDGREIDYGTVDDSKTGFSTEAYAADGSVGDHELKCSTATVVRDKASYWGLEEGGGYVLTGRIVDKETGEALKGADGAEVTATTEFEASGETGSATTEFTFDSTGFEGRAFVVYETLTKKSGEYVARHEDIDSAEQTLTFPKVGTTARDGATGSDEAGSTMDGKVKLVDTVAYEGLVGGRTYDVTGTLMDKETGEAISGADGKAVTAQASFKADESGAGTVDVTFEFDASCVEGKTTVAFEEVTRDGREVAVHADIDDVPQRLHFPKVRTTAKDKKTGGQVGLASAESGLVDTVAFENLLAGRKYTLSGTLVDKGTGEAVKDADGNAVTASAGFVPEETEGAEIAKTAWKAGDGTAVEEETVSGTVDVEFAFDASTVAGKTTVVFETLSLDGEEVAEHADIDDSGQTVAYPKIGTTAVDGATGAHEGLASETVKIVDTVAYENLTPGEKYTVTGTLMDKESGEALKGADGNVVTASAEFAPQQAAGTVDVEFEFDGSLVAGKTTVVFEDVYQEETAIAVHADIDDAGQTVAYPKIGTTATDAADGDHEVEPAQAAKIVDTVAYENLTVGQKYTVSGTLMDKETAEALKGADGEEVTASAEFTPQQAAGTVDVAFEFDASALEGKSLVAFERVANGDGAEVAVHEDLDDEGQTVEIARSPAAAAAKSLSAKTGDKLPELLMLALVVAGAAAIAASCVWRHRRKRAAEAAAAAGGQEVVAEAAAIAEGAQGASSAPEKPARGITGLPADYFDDDKPDMSRVDGRKAVTAFGDENPDMAGEVAEYTAGELAHDMEHPEAAGAELFDPAS